MASVLESCYGSLEIGAVRVGGARVLVGTDRLADSRLRKGGREGDGLNDGSSGGIVWGPGVDGEGAEALGGSRWPGRRGDGVVALRQGEAAARVSGCRLVLSVREARRVGRRGAAVIAPR